MKAVLMAGGEGTRLRPLTVNTPKPLVPVCGIPVMEHMISLLKKHNITDIVVTLHYLADEIISYFGNGRDLGVNIEYSIEDEPLGTAGSIKKIADRLKEPFLIVSGDAVADFDFTEFVRFHNEKKSKASIILKKVENPLEFGIVITSKDSSIKKFLEKPTWGEVFTDTVNTGIYCLDPEVLDLMEDGKVYDFSKNIFPAMMEKEMPLYGCVLDGYWCDIGNIEQYRQSACDIFNGKVRVRIPGKEVSPGIFIGENTYVHPDASLSNNVVIGRNCRIGKDVQIKDFVSIGDNCVISPGTIVERSIIWRNAYIGKDSVISGTIMGQGAVTKEKVRTNDGAIVGDRCFLGTSSSVNANVKIWPDKKIEAGAVVSLSLIWGGRWTGSMFGNDGIGGLANIEITPEFALKLGSAFGSFLDKGSVVNTSRDDHPASRMINRAIICGLVSSGIDVSDIRVVPSAVARKITALGFASGGVHVRMKPYDPNSVFIEFFDSRGINISKADERKIENYFAREDFRRSTGSGVGRIEFPPRTIENYSASFLKCLDIKSISESSFKIVIDYGSSSASEVFPYILGKLGCETVSINSYIDPERESIYSKQTQLAQLSKVVTTLKANAGIYIDADSESFFLIDEKGRVVRGNRLLVLMAYFIAKTHEKPLIAVPSSAPSCINKMMWNIGGEIVRAKSGRQALMEVSMEKNVLFAGNDRGAFIFPEFNSGFDSLFAFAKILEMMSISGISIAEAFDSLPEFHIAKADVECAFSDKGSIMSNFYEYCDTHPFSASDGIKIFFAKSWGLIVPDKTEPVLHLAAEAETDEKAMSIILHLKHNIKQFKSEKKSGSSALKARKEIESGYEENISGALRFYFWTPGEYTGYSVSSVKEFIDSMGAVPSESIEFHFKRGHIENWLRDHIHNSEAADAVRDLRMKGIEPSCLNSAIKSVLKELCM